MKKRLRKKLHKGSSELGFSFDAKFKIRRCKWLKNGLGVID